MGWLQAVVRGIAEGLTEFPYRVVLGIALVVLLVTGIVPAT